MLEPFGLDFKCDSKYKPSLLKCGEAGSSSKKTIRRTEDRGEDWSGDLREKWRGEDDGCGGGRWKINWSDSRGRYPGIFSQSLK